MGMARSAWMANALRRARRSMWGRARALASIGIVSETPTGQFPGPPRAGVVLRRRLQQWAERGQDPEPIELESACLC